MQDQLPWCQPNWVESSRNISQHQTHSSQPAHAGRDGLWAGAWMRIVTVLALAVGGRWRQGLKSLFVSRRTSYYGLSEGGHSLNSIFADCWLLLVIGSSVSLLWEMMWLSVSIRCIRYSKRCKFRPKMRQSMLGGLAPPVPLGELERSPDSLSLIHIWRCRRSYACRSRWSPYH